jgi:hypothetical protein
MKADGIQSVPGDPLSCRRCEISTKGMPETKKCSRCESVYCDNICQKEDWNAHKNICDAPAPACERPKRQSSSSYAMTSFGAFDGNGPLPRNQAVYGDGGNGAMSYIRENEGFGRSQQVHTL